MSKQGKSLLSIAALLFLCLAIWVIRTTPDAPPAQKEVLLDGDIVVTTSDGAKLTSDRLEWYEGKDLLAAIGKAKITKDDLLAEGDRIESTNGYQHFRIVGHAHLVKGHKGDEGAKKP